MRDNVVRVKIEDYLIIIHMRMGWRVAQWVERRTSQSMNRVPIPPATQEKLNDFFRVKHGAMTCRRCAQPPCVCICTLKILQSMSEFGGLRKHEKTQHALVGLGSAALAAAVTLLR